MDNVDLIEREERHCPFRPRTIVPDFFRKSYHDLKHRIFILMNNLFPQFVMSGPQVLYTPMSSFLAHDF